LNRVNPRSDDKVVKRPKKSGGEKPSDTKKDTKGTKDTKTKTKKPKKLEPSPLLPSTEEQPAVNQNPAISSPSQQPIDQPVNKFSQISIENQYNNIIRVNKGDRVLLEELLKQSNGSKPVANGGEGT
jgi:hypothetical protein